MKKKESRFSSFRGRVSENAKETPRGESKSLLKLPQGVSFLVFDEKTIRVHMDFLPYVISDKKHPDKQAVVGDLWYKRPYRVHRNIGANNKSLLCRSSIGERCPACEYQKELLDKEERDLAISLYPKDRVLYIPIPLDSDKHDAEPKYVWDMAESLFQKELNKELEKDDENDVFPSLEEGKTLKIKFKWDVIGKKGKPFPEVVDIEFKDRDAYDEDILEEVPNLDDIIRDSVLSYEEFKAAFFELDAEEDGGSLKEDKEGDDEKSERSARKKPEASSRSRKEEEPKRGRKEEEAPRGKKKPEPEPDITWEELEGMLARKLKKVVSEFDLQEDYDDFDDDSLDEFREAIAEEMNIEIPKKPASRRAAAKEEKESERASSRKKPEPEEEKPRSQKPAKEEEPEEDIPVKERCVACKGTGKNSRGRKCPICEGTGRKKKEKEEEPEDEKPSRSKRSETGKSDDECPHGHKFGVDTEKFEDCDDCKLWNKCADEKDKRKKK